MTIAILMIAMSSLAQKTGTFTDSRDGKVYKTVTIGSQTWMAENLAYKANSTCLAYMNNQSNAAIYGYLYNWETSKKVCPLGWHLPSDSEWTALITFLGGESEAGNKMKEAGTTHWTSPNTDANNSSGFNALPGGTRFVNSFFFHLGKNGYWWSATENDASHAWSYYLDYNSTNIFKYSDNKASIYSVRCLKN